MSRYDIISRIKKKGVIRIGTAYLREFEERNSDILLIETHGDRCDLI